MLEDKKIQSYMNWLCSNQDDDNSPHNIIIPPDIPVCTNELLGDFIEGWGIRSMSIYLGESEENIIDGYDDLPPCPLNFAERQTLLGMINNQFLSCIHCRYANSIVIREEIVFSRLLRNYAKRLLLDMKNDENN